MRKSVILMMTLVLILVTTVPVLAASKPWITQSGTYLVRDGQILKRDLIFSGDEVEINGTLKGDLVVFAKKVIINGTVDGSVIGIITEKLTVDGKIIGNLRVIAGIIEIDGAITDSVTSIAYKIETQPRASLENGLLGFANNVSLMGTISGPVQLTTVAMNTIGGKINGDIIVHGAPVNWMEKATVIGNIDDYTGIEQSKDKVKANISGAYRNHYRVEYLAEAFKTMLVISLIMFVGNLLNSLIFNRLFPLTAWKISTPSISNFRRYLFTGLLSFFLIPLLIVGLVFTRVGIPLAILLGLIYIIVFFFSGITLNLWVGRIILARSAFNN
ncbi:MAG TPA: polymer-forming cytoskeletal protein, partial [Bacillota bacterium]|nr:polymer-forming cytoskeletal protein [Bacillota bacterium]